MSSPIKTITFIISLLVVNWPLSSQPIFPAYQGLIESYKLEDTSFFSKTQSDIETTIQLKDEKNKILSHLALAQIYTSRKQFENAGKFYISALTSARHLGDRGLLFWCYYKTGWFYQLQRVSESKTVRYFYLAKQNYEGPDSTKVYQTLLRRIAYIELITENYALAEASYKAILRLPGFGQSTEEEIVVYNNLGNTQIALKKFEIAKRYLDTTLNLSLKSNDSVAIARCYVNFGNMYFEQKKYQEALQCYLYSNAIRTRLNILPAIKECDVNLGKVYHSIGQFSKARQYLESAMHYADTVKEGYALNLMLLPVLSECYAKIGEPTLAYQSLKKLEDLKAQTQRDLEKEKTRQLNADYTFEKKLVEDSLKFSKQALEAKFEAQNQLALKDQQHKQNIILLAVFILTLAIIGAVLFVNQKQKNQLKLKISETKALQAQMNPHFIFNSLNSVLEFVSKSRTEDAINYLTRFSRLIRMVLEHSGRKTVLLSEEIEMLKHYVALENVRTENPFEFIIDISPTIDTSIIEIPTMLLQPFIENSIIHGIMNKNKLSEESGVDYKGVLVMKLSEEDGFLNCVIEDNGIGIEQARAIKEGKIIKHQSMGLQITKHRLNLMHEKDSRITYFDLKDEGGQSKGTRVEIVIPLKETY